MLEKLKVDMEKEKALDASGSYITSFVEFVIQYSVDCKSCLKKFLKNV